MAEQRPIEEELLHFDRTVMRIFNSFAEADQADREYWWSRSAADRLKALEHIRQHAWSYNDATRPKLQGSVAVLERRRS